MGTTPSHESSNNIAPTNNSVVDKSPKTPKNIIPQNDKTYQIGQQKIEQNTQKGDSSLVPTMFSWSGGGEQVFVAGTFTNWKKIPLTRSQNDFTAILNIQPGQQQYKFFVDGDWKCAEDQPTVHDTAGNVNNALYIDKTDPHPSNLLDISSGSPPGEYSQHIPDDFGSLPMNAAHGRAAGGRPQGPVPFREPPTVPPHLLRSLLNSKVVDERDIVILPVPHSVMLSHLYVLKTNDNDVITLAVTNRYKQKFVTTIFYKKVIIY